MRRLSMVRAGRALVFALGYLPAGAQQHKTVVELTGRILGDEYAGLVRRFDVMRKRRNVFFYDSEDLHSGTEAHSAVECAAALLGKIKDKARESR
ncbi:MAG: hypothetical protein HY922_00775 [Elusimicrobia bacterium]|nr:hypothetical protein [Elusimicrobiota bacterium]